MPTTVFNEILPQPWNINNSPRPNQYINTSEYQYYQYQQQTTPVSSFLTGNASSSGSSLSESSASSSSHEDIYSPLRSPDTTTVEHVAGGTKPYLQIIEQPADKYRFRYKTEMQGTHGAILGANVHKTQKKSFPKVKLWNYSPTKRGEKLVIRCTLYTADKDKNKRTPHVHRLVGKHSGEERDDPHDFDIVPPSYTAVFEHLTILFTKKEEQLEILVKKKENIARRRFRDVRDSSYRTPNIEELKASALVELARMNLNVVTLRFDALVDGGQGQYVPLCPPVYSSPISNMKNPQTNELKICRVDKIMGSCEGREEVFIFVEKVVKKNIKVRFYEVDENTKSIVWSAYAEFSPDDVHHQFGIAFRTPPYRDPNIEQNKLVYFELFRPSDQAVSEPKEFEYTPNPNSIREFTRKRPRLEDDNLYPTTVLDFQTKPTSLTSHDPVVNTSLFADDSLLRELISSFPGDIEMHELLGEQATNQTSSHVSFNQILETLPSADSEAISLLLGSGRFEEWARLNGEGEAARALMSDQVTSTDQLVFEGVCKLNLVEPQIEKATNKPHSQMDVGETGLIHRAQRGTVVAKSAGSFKLDEDNIVQSIEKTLNNLLKLKRNRKITETLVKSCLLRLFSYSVGDNGNCVFHILAASEHLTQATKFINILKIYDMDNKVVNTVNIKNETALHVAARRGSAEMIALLLEAGCDVNAVDNKNNTSSHVVVYREHQAVAALAALFKKRPDLTISNKDGFTVLHLAVVNRKSDIISCLLVKSEEDFFPSNLINLQDRKNGNTALHIAVHYRYKEVVTLLLNFDEQLDIDSKNFAGKTPLAFVYEASDPDAKVIQEQLISNNANPNLVDYKKKEYKDEEEEEVETKQENEATQNEVVDESLSAYAREWEATELMDETTVSKLCPLLDKHGDWKILLRNLHYREHEIEYCMMHWSPTLLALKIAAVNKPWVTVETIRDQLLTMDLRLQCGAQFIDDMLLRRLGLE